MYDAFVLAAGFGTRLRPLSALRPKPLVPICGVPLLAYALALCERHGLRRVVVNAHHLADQLGGWSGRQAGVDVDVIVESPEILGTGGGLKNVEARLADRFVVVNGDVLCDVDLGALRDAVPPGGAAMALRSADDAARFGVVAADAAGRVVELASVARAVPQGTVDRSTHFTGLHAMDREALACVPDGFSCIVRTAYAALVPERRVAALRHDGTWLDVGTPEAYLDANLLVLGGGVPLPLDPFARAAAGGPGEAWIGRGARTPGARIVRSVIGPAARIAAGATLEDCVVWEGVEVPPGRWRRAVFYASDRPPVLAQTDGDAPARAT